MYDLAAIFAWTNQNGFSMLDTPQGSLVPATGFVSGAKCTRASVVVDFEGVQDARVARCAFVRVWV